MTALKIDPRLHALAPSSDLKNVRVELGLHAMTAKLDGLQLGAPTHQPPRSDGLVGYDITLTP